MDVTPGDETEPRTLRRAQCGHRAAQAELLRSLQDVWYRNCLSLLRDDEAARDAVQETALRFLQGLPGFRWQSTLKTWSLGIALNVCRETWRETARARSRLRVTRPDPPTPDALMLRDERVEWLREAIDGLAERQREVVVLRYFEGLSVSETATAMGCATGTVKATLSQALARLRQQSTGVES